MNLVYIPYHDWRKLENEGHRTRDAHFIKAFQSNKSIDKLIIVNRPISLVELVLKKRTLSKRLNGNLLLQNKNKALWQIDNKTYIVDSIENDNIRHLRKGRAWYFEAYGYNSLREFVDICLSKLEVDNEVFLSSNLFSASFFKRDDLLIFDAWDNFLKFPSLNKIYDNALNAYSTFALLSHSWLTNSNENIDFFKLKYSLENIYLVRNGVDSEPFSKSGLNLVPKDILKIKERGNVIVGFGGKITHLFDSDLFNYLTQEHSDKDFVIVGQILNKSVFNQIVKRKNVYYLGDKHYSVYPSYVKNFNVGIIPYKVKESQHGGDSIKLYEYLAAGLPVIATDGNGAQNFRDIIEVVNNKDEFSKCLENPRLKKEPEIEKYSWSERISTILEIFRNA